MNHQVTESLSKKMSYFGPGWGVGPSDCAEEVGAGGGVVGGGEVSMGWAQGDGVEVVEEDEGGGGAAEVVSVWEDESLGRACQEIQNNRCYLLTDKAAIA